MTDTNVVPPSSITVNFKRIKDDQDKTIKDLFDDDEIWAVMGESPAYRLLKKYIVGLINRLDALVDTAIENGATESEIGTRTLVNRLTKSNLMSIVNKVERTTEKVNEKRGIRKPTEGTALSS